MIEPEMAFCDLNGDMDLAEEIVKYLVHDIRENCPDEMELFSKFVDKELLSRLDFVLERPFQRTTYAEAVDLLKKSGEEFEFPVEYGLNLQSEHERWLTEKHFKCPVTVFNFPKEIKPFYMRLNDDGKTVTAMDLLVPGIGEIVGGSQREATTVARQFPITLTQVRPMSISSSTPKMTATPIGPSPAGTNVLSVANRITSDARGTPATPLEVSINVSIIVIC